jgi:hypothetical protein
MTARRDGEMSISFADDRRAYLPGERVKGQAYWSFEDVPARIEVRLGWKTVGKGTTDTKVVAHSAVERVTASGSWAFDLRLPDEPYSLIGKLISIVWSVELVVDRSGLRKDIKHAETIAVGPDLCPVVLPAPITDD